MPQVSTYIGIALYSTAGFPCQLAIVLSNHKDYKTIELCGTVIETVNGWVESWRESGRSPAVFEPYLKLEGILNVGKVNKPPSHISASISSHGWRAQDAVIDRESQRVINPYSNDYVCQAVLHLCRRRTISLPPAMIHWEYICGNIMCGLFCIQEERREYPDIFKPESFDSFPIFPLVAPEDEA
jgi:hypothetical protein